MRKISAGLRGLFSVFIANFYLKKADQAYIVFSKYPSFKQLFYLALNELCYILKSSFSFKLLSLHIELTNNCNLRCVMCPVNETMKREKGFLEFKTLESIVSQVPDVGYIALHNWGESLLHPDLIQIIKYCQEKKIRVMLYTNGLLLEDAPTREALLDSGIERLVISLDGVGLAYEQIRKVEYNRISRVIEALLAYRKQQNIDVKLEISTTLFEANANAKESVYSAWGDKIDHIYFQPCFEKSLNKRKKACRELWRGNLIVLWDGRIVPCCVDFDAKIVLGNVREDDLNSVFNSKKMRRLRFNHKQGNLAEPCLHCSEFICKGVSARFS